MKPKDFHQAKWNEPIIMELGCPGERGIAVSQAEPRVISEAGNINCLIPSNLQRKTPPALPEMSQMQVQRHFLRLSQETIGADMNIDIGL
ncbi:MAG: glycine dehydrogenase subunit 2, partial [bacterium]|nr:glycine dehydrogenase subunit 2 [bacterium]